MPSSYVLEPLLSTGRYVGMLLRDVIEAVDAEEVENVEVGRNPAENVWESAVLREEIVVGVFTDGGGRYSEVYIATVEVDDKEDVVVGV